MSFKNKKSKFFILLTVILLLLFAAQIFSNWQVLKVQDLPDSSHQIQEQEILIRLEEAGLEPREAEYYEVIDG